MAKVKHIALLKFKAGTSAEQIDGIFSELLDATETIPGIEDYVAGPNCSTEGLSQGYTHGFIITFTDLAAVSGYLAHADHAKVKTLLETNAESVVVFDFEV